MRPLNTSGESDWSELYDKSKQKNEKRTWRKNGSGKKWKERYWRFMREEKWEESEIIELKWRLNERNEWINMEIEKNEWEVCEFCEWGE